VHVFGYPVDMRGLEKTGVPIVEDACEALGGTYADGGPIGGRGHPAVFAFYANKQMTTGEGGLVVCGDPAMKEQMDSERNQGRAPNMDWLDHDRLGFNYRLSDIACALGLAQLERLDTLLADRERVAALYREALAALEGVTLPCENSGQARRGWFVYVIQLPHGVDRDAVVTELGTRGVAAKPYFPAIHLMSYYREKFGYREGQFPVCEDVAARSIAIPFFPQMTEGQVARVAEQLGAVLHSSPGASRP
jgi:perosamine synthetase